MTQIEMMNHETQRDTLDTSAPLSEASAAASDAVSPAPDDEDDGFAPPPFLKAPTDHPLWPAIMEALKQFYDPEIPVNIYELGLIYHVSIDAGNTVDIKMSLTAPGCPVAGEMPGWVNDAVQAIETVKSATVEIVWDPPWTPDMMSEFARMELGMF